MASLIELSDEFNNNTITIIDELKKYATKKMPLILPMKAEPIKNSPVIKKSEPKKVIIQKKEAITLAVDIGEIDQSRLGTYSNPIWDLEHIINNKINIVDLIETECIDKGKHKLSDGEDEVVCIKCGLVIGQELSEQERRAYTSDEIKNRSRTEKKYREFGPRTIIDKTDINRLNISPKQKGLFFTLSKIQGSLIGSLERNFWEATPMLDRLKDYVNNDSVITEAWRMYKKVATLKLTMGRSISGFVAASVYAAMKNNNITIIQEDFLEAVKKIDEHLTINTVLKNYQKMINKCITRGCGPKNVSEQIITYGNKLKLHPKVIEESSKYLTYFTNGKGDIPVGISADGVYGAIFYHILKKTNLNETVTSYYNYNWPKTQSEIASGVGTTEVTLRTRKKELDCFIRLEENKKNFHLNDKSFRIGVNNLREYVNNNDLVNQRDNINPIVDTLTYLIIVQSEKNNDKSEALLKKYKTSKDELMSNIKKYFPKAYKKYFQKVLEQ